MLVVMSHQRWSALKIEEENSFADILWNFFGLVPIFFGNIFFALPPHGRGSQCLT